MSWSKRFDEPIVLERRHHMRTLREAIAYLVKTVPPSERKHEKVLVAADHLTRSAEQTHPMYFARAATLRAIHRNDEIVFDPDRKDTIGGSAS